MMTYSEKALLYFRIMFIVVFVLTNLFFPCEAKKSHQPNDSTSAKTGNPIRFEHIAFNVPDPVATVKWYTTNLGMKIMRAGSAPTYTTFLADSGEHMMIELFHNVNYPVFESGKIHQLSLHLAFVTPDIAQTQKQLVAAGAVVIDSIRKTESGDQVMALRDPWGLPVQIIQHVKHTLGFSGLYMEHLALNVAESRTRAQWYKDYCGMVIVRESPPPVSRVFIADAGKNMMFELYQQQEYPVIDFTTISHMSIHIAFMVDDIQAAKSTLVAAGAKVVDDVTKTASGDFVLMLRDPWGLPIQFVKRGNAMLK
jgi:catechol 2,3-dioxygenase-like lactoylglutathione lyase family enzyme